MFLSPCTALLSVYYCKTWDFFTELWVTLYVLGPALDVCKFTCWGSAHDVPFLHLPHVSLSVSLNLHTQIHTYWWIYTCFYRQTVWEWFNDICTFHL